MEATILKATNRIEAPKKVRNAGFIPGVLNEADTTSTSVQFETNALNKIISKHGSNAKMWIELDGKKMFGFIKEVQRHPVEGKVIHIAVQLISMSKEIKMHLPVTFHGREELENKFLEIHVYKTEIEVSGMASLMPDVVVADVSKKEAGDNVTVSDFNLPDSLKAIDSETEIYAMIRTKKEAPAEEPVAPKPGLAMPAEVKAAV